MNFTIILYFSLRDTFMHGSLGFLVLNPKRGGVGYSLTWPIRGRTAGQGMVLRLSVLNGIH